ncbi:MAG: DUF3343 domain-containing protein [Solirubrobacterales bacterium]
MNYYLITFKNTHSAISSEKILKEKGIEVVVMPTPTTITKSCGISIKIGLGDFEKVKNLIKESDFEPGSIYLKNELEYEMIEL